MVSKRRDRPRRPARRATPLEPRPRILVLCEGRVTEPLYLRGFRAACRNPRVDIEIDGTTGVPRTLVEAAKERKKRSEREAKRADDENLLYDEIWCVFDVDEHPEVAASIQMARDAATLVAVSNPCFELWLLLHLRESPGARHRDDLQRMLAALLPGCGKRVPYERVGPGYRQAVERAQRLDHEAEAVGEAGRNPTSGVWHLTESIRGDADPAL